MDFAEFATRNKEAEARIAEAKGRVLLSDEQFLVLERWITNVAIAASTPGAVSASLYEQVRQAARVALTGKE